MEHKLFWLIITVLFSGSFGIIFKIVWDWLKSNKKDNIHSECAGNIKWMANGVDTINKSVDYIGKKVKWLEDLHNVMDEDGVPLVYMPRRIVNAMTSIPMLLDKIIDKNELMIEALNKNGDLLRKLDTDAQINAKKN